MQAIDRSLNGSWRLLPASLVVLGGRLPPLLRAAPARALLDDGVDGLFQGARLGRGVWCLLPRSEHSLAELAELFAAERLTHLREPLAFLFLDVVLHTLDEHRRLGVEAIVVRVHREQLHTQHVRHVMLLVGLEDVVLDVRQQRADLRVHDLVLDVGVNRQQLDDLRDELTLAFGVIIARLLEVLEQLPDLFVVVLEQHDGVRRHGSPLWRIWRIWRIRRVRRIRSLTKVVPRTPAREPAAVDAAGAAQEPSAGTEGPAQNRRGLGSGRPTVDEPEDAMTGSATKYVYDFAEGSKEMKDLLGGKGANLAEMTNLKLPVPPGFTVTTEACRTYLKTGAEPEGLSAEVDEHLAALERAMGKQLGKSDDPLLVSVRSGAKFSMPGMMETVLNIGLNDQSVRGLAKQADNERFAFDSYRRLIQMFGKTVLGIAGEHFEDALDEAKRANGSDNDLDLNAEDLRKVVETFKDVVVEHAGRPFPQDPREQMDMAVRAVFESWNTERAIIYRRQERIPSELGTAVNIVAMVFGNLGMDSGTGVAFTRDPASGAQGVYGDYLQNAQGEDVVAGIRNTVPLKDLRELDRPAYDELMVIMRRLEEHYRDLCDIEFTVERGKLWMLQTRVGKRTAAAAFRIATQLVDQGLIDMNEALSRVNGAQLAQLMFPQFDPAAPRQLLARGMNASPGAAVGRAVFDSAPAVGWPEHGDAVILVRRETSPDDLHGMVASAGVLTSRGG